MCVCACVRVCVASFSIYRRPILGCQSPRCFLRTSSSRENLSRAKGISSARIKIVIIGGGRGGEEVRSRVFSAYRLDSAPAVRAAQYHRRTTCTRINNSIPIYPFSFSSPRGLPGRGRGRGRGKGRGRVRGSNTGESEMRNMRTCKDWWRWRCAGSVSLRVSLREGEQDGRRRGGG